MGEQDAVQKYLQERGCEDEVIARGLAGLVVGWERMVEDLVGEPYPVGLDDYLNDLDTRDILNGALAAAGTGALAVRAAMESADEEFKAATLPVKVCLWGESLARQHGWTARKEWWYYRVPTERGADLEEDMKAAGIKISRP